MTIGEFFIQCRDANINVDEADFSSLAPAVCTRLDHSVWRTVAVIAKRNRLRWCAFWARETDDGFEVFSCLESGGTYVVLRAGLGRDDLLPSQASVYPAADRPERHAHDLLGVKLEGAPDTRRWTRHVAWGQNEFPLQTTFSLAVDGQSTPPDDRYPFVTARGTGVVEIPVGPVHAGIIEPGHFRFQAIGETILNLEEHLGYVHKGIEKIAVDRDAHGLARLAARISGDSTVAHSWAACQAIERATGVEPPPRALWLRAIMCERERVANHMGDIGAICNDVGFTFGQAQLTRLKEQWVRESGRIFGHRLMMDKIIPGGVCVDPDENQLARMFDDAGELSKEFSTIIERIEGSESLEDRLMTTGRLTPEQAQMLGCIGYVGRASGQDFDVRHHAAYPPYDRLQIDVPVFRAGDVAARAKVRAEEVVHSLNLIRDLLNSPPDGPVSEDLVPKENVEGIGLIDGWRGEIVTYVRLGQDARVERFFPRDPSWLTWPALELLIQDNIVPDFPVCNKSINGSYSGQDL